MKKFGYLACMLLLLAGTVSCGGNDPLSKSSAKKAVEKEAMFAKDSQVAQFETGFYEASPELMNKLAQLKAAGVITYSVETAIETTRESRWVSNYYYGGYYTYFDREVPHVFVNVSLTEEGKKFVVENPTVMRKDYAKLVKHNEDYKEEKPEYMNAVDNTFDNLSSDSKNDKKEEVAEEVVEENVEVVEEVSDTILTEGDAPVNKTDNSKPEKVDKNAKYNSLLARVKSEKVNVLLGRFKVVKIMDVCCSEDMFKAGVGSCNVVYTFTDPTPFGYVLSDYKPDYYLVNECKFRLYQDTGWAVENMKGESVAQEVVAE